VVARFAATSRQGQEHSSQRIVVAFVSEQHFTSLPHAAMHCALGSCVWPLVKPHASAESTVTFEKQLPTSPGFGWQDDDDGGVAGGELGGVVVVASEPASGVVSVLVLLPHARSPKKKRRGRARVTGAGYMGETRKKTVMRCPECGATDVVWDETRSRYEFTWMQCNACGEGGLVDSWQRDFDWFTEIELAEGAPLPAKVAPLPRGHGIAENPVVTMGCAECSGRDAAVAWGASQHTRRASIVDESHFSIRTSACHCGQRFVVVFTERIDWAGGEDDQTWILLPIDADEEQRITRAGEGGAHGAITELGRERRFLVRSHPTGEGLSVWWRNGGLSIGPHD
jgi:hypothetical protein